MTVYLDPVFALSMVMINNVVVTSSREVDFVVYREQGCYSLYVYTNVVESGVVGPSVDL